MNNRITIFLIALIILLIAYLYSVNKMIMYNHSGNVIKKITVSSEFSNKVFVNVKDGAVLKFTFFSPFDKKVRIQIQQPNQINSTIFSLQGFFLGEKYNQVEITEEGKIKSGTLGIER